MSVHFISGKPGGGKTLYSVRLIVDELVFGSRVVITNVPLDIGALNAYLQAQFPKKSVDVLTRVWVLDDDQTGLFWTFRPGGVKIARLTKDEWQTGKTPSYAGVKDSGVLYVIDEVHNFFGARQWAETGRDVLFYLSQHRKLGDTVICITQAIGNVDKAFRSLTQDFTFLRNLCKEKYGMFRLPSYFIRKTFTSPPTETSQPMESGTFTLDVSGLASCYNTAAGVGIHGRLADSTERKKGFHWSYALVLVVIITILVFFAAPSAIAKLFDSPKASEMARSKVVSSSRPPVTANGVAAVTQSGVAPVTVALVTPPSNVVTMVAYSTLGGGRMAFILSDGRRLDTEDTRFQGFTKQWVKFAGVTYYAAPNL